MLKITAKTNIILATKPADFRKGIDGFIRYCQVLSPTTNNTKTGSLFVFINKARTMIRILSYDGTGYWLATKRISQGRFQDWPVTGDPVSSQQAERLMTILQ